MIKYLNKNQCCGCSSCSQKCPTQSIAMTEDDEGFLYPSIDLKRCIDCHLCEKVCPFNVKIDKKEPLLCFAAKNSDDLIREKSSSGGIFSYFASQVIKRGGVVFGAKFDEQWGVVHSYTDKLEDLDWFRGSKYLQSDISDSYHHCLKFLKENREVLFSGTPCQILGLYLFLGKKYDQLITIDFICHGVPSPKVFKQYLREEMSSINPQAQLLEIQFRNKRNGWKNFSFYLKYRIGDRLLETFSSFHDNLYIQGFLQNLYLRPSCYNCPAKNGTSGSDITLADFWGINKTFPEFDDDKGVSAIIVNSEKWKQFDLHKLLLKSTSLSAIVNHNSAYCKSVIKPNNRNVFFQKQDLNCSDKIRQLIIRTRKAQAIIIIKRIMSLLRKFKFSITSVLSK